MRRVGNKSIIPTTFIHQKIYFTGGARVMRDADLTKLYGATTSNLNQAVAARS
jgi:hypothetical protein